MAVLLGAARVRIVAASCWPSGLHASCSAPPSIGSKRRWCSVGKSNNAMPAVVATAKIFPPGAIATLRAPPIPKARSGRSAASVSGPIVGSGKGGVVVGGGMTSGAPGTGIVVAIGVGGAVGSGGAVGANCAVGAGRAEATAWMDGCTDGAAATVAEVIGAGDTSDGSGAPAHPAKANNAATIRAWRRGRWQGFVVFIVFPSDGGD